MASKLKIAAIALTTVFATAATPVVALYVELWMETEKMSAEGRADIAALESQEELTPEERLVREVRTKAFENCMEKNALPLLGIAQTSRNWSNRLSFWPAASYKLNDMSDITHMRGLAQGISCLHQLELTAPPAPSV